MDFELAHQYFQEMKVIANEDGGTLWGRSLEGPMLFVDHKSRTIAANQADLEGNLSKRDDVYTGKLPGDVGIANTAIEWAGVKWTMVIWPLSEDQYRRARLMVHESFHRIQDDLGLSKKKPQIAILIRPRVEYGFSLNGERLRKRYKKAMMREDKLFEMHSSLDAIDNLCLKKQKPMKQG